MTVADYAASETINSMQSHLQKALVFTIATAIALKLFVLGLSFPLELRVRGDAHGYLTIADGFSDYLSLWTYAGERTVGFPAFEYLVRKVLAVISPTVFLLSWINSIGLVLLATHLFAAWYFSVWARKSNLVKSEITGHLLFIFIATFPALIGHTTSPLTDTFTVDLVMLALVFFESALCTKVAYKRATLAACAAVFFAFSILVRPASLIGVGVALTVCGGVSLWGTRQNKLAIGTTIVGCLIVLAPAFKNCAEKYDQFCLQSPKTVNVNLSVQEGLRGARIMWSRPVDIPGRFPMVPDKVMSENYYQQCQITAIAGFYDNSFTGCLLARPLTLPAFVVKKWIGLFDYFRFTPYLENHTPSWLRILSRIYGTFAWVGLCLFFITMLTIRKKEIQLNLKRLLADNIGLVLLATYSMTILAQHTAIHTEERYGFPLLPLCAAMVFSYAERTITRYRTFGWRHITPILIFCIFSASVFVVQIIAWDTVSLLKSTQVIAG